MGAATRKIRIAIDAMGGDYAPQEIVKGAVEAATMDKDLEPILVGPLDIVEKELSKHDVAGLDIRCIHADDFVKEEENPARIVRRRPNSSIAVAARLVRSGEADGLLGATGSLVTSAIQYLGMIDGIERPALGAVLSKIAPTTVTLDLGANMDCRPKHLLDFAIIGTVYARVLLEVSRPKVALLNIGREAVKGNQLAKETYPLLEKSGLDFIGNIEGHEIFSGKANVIVCDGFVGNALFKFSEAVGEIIDSYIKNVLRDEPEVQQLITGKLSHLMGLLALTHDMGGGILWGINGLVAKTHGNSQAPMIVKRLGNVKLAVERDVVGCLKSELARVRESIDR